MKAKLVDILLEKFKESKMGQQLVDNIQRQCLLHIILQLVETVNKEIQQVVLEHFFSLKEENEVQDITQTVYKFCEKGLSQDTWEIILPLF
jgi:hypothetical protein